MMNPLVTISIPLFKCESFIEKTMLSIKNQTYKNIEVSLIDDLSPDNSVTIVEQFILDNQCENWSVYHLEKNSGLSVVRNKGIEEASGKYIFFVDSDDELLPFAIEKLVKLAEENNSEMVMGEVDGVILPSFEKIDVFPIKTSKHILESNRSILESLVNGEFAVSSWNKLIRLDFLRNHNLYFTEGLFAQDALHTFEMALKLDSMAFLREKTYIYYLHENSVIHNRKAIHFDNWITIAEKINDHYKVEKNPSIKVLIKKYLIDFKVVTLLMNWKAQHDERLWKKNYSAYSQLASLTFRDYFSSDYSGKMKKDNFFISLPKNLGFKFFKWRYQR